MTNIATKIPFICAANVAANVAASGAASGGNVPEWLAVLPLMAILVAFAYAWWS